LARGVLLRRVIMRRLALLLFVAATGCATSSVPEGAPTYSSVKDRLAHPTRLYIGPGTSTGMITAERYTHDGWVSGATPITITHGELDGALDSTGKLAVSGFEVDVDPIDIPESVFGKPAQLADIRVVLAKPSTADVVWSGDDDAAATLTLALDLSWTLVVNGQASPLGAQHLPPIVISTALTGAGDHVDAQLSLDATGTLWNWADLLKLTEMKMSLDAGSTDAM
jgi:hypothetical protein